MNDRDATALLQGLVSVPSVSCEEGPVAELAVEEMARAGFDAHVDRVGNAVGVIGNGPLEAVLLGHIDTVPGEIPVRIEDGKLYGRGSVDAKGPFAAFIAGTARAFATQPDLPLRAVVVGCVEEEVPSSRGARFARDNYEPDICIVGEPSGWDGITLGYKGYMRATMRLVGGSSHTAHQEHTMAERAFATWQSLRTSTDEFNDGRDKPFDQLFTRLVNIQTGTDGRYDWADLALNIRLPLDLSPEAAEGWLRDHVSEGDVTVLGHMPAWLGARTTPLHRALAGAIREVGGVPRYVRKTGTADLNIVAPAWGCPALAYGPGDAALDHTPNEHILVDEFLKGVAVLDRALRDCARRFGSDQGADA